MRATTYTPAHPDKTFKIAVTVVAILGLLEFLVISVHYAGRARAARAAAQPPSATAATQAAVPAATPVVPQVAPSAVPQTTTTAQAQPSPTSATLSVVERLLQEATQLRERGDTANALARLQDASQREPQNAKVLAEMAMIYESIQALDKSSAVWQKIENIGPSAGALYELAELKLRVGVAPGAPASAAVPGFTGVSPLNAGNTRTDPEGIPDGSTFGITEATVAKTPDPEADTNLTLRVGVKVRPQNLVDHTKVKIQVYFYDTVDNNKVALTDAEVNYEWVTPNHDWKSTNPEVLAVSYVRLKNGAISSEAALTEAAAAVTPPISGKKARPAAKKPEADPSREYAGYQVRVYYNDQLQDVRAEPTKLLNLFPPPLTLAAQ